MQNMQNLKSLFKQMFILYDTIIVREKLKPAKNDQIWLVLVLYRCFIRRLPIWEDCLSETTTSELCQVLSYIGVTRDNVQTTVLVRELRPLCTTYAHSISLLLILNCATKIWLRWLGSKSNKMPGNKFRLFNYYQQSETNC